MTNKNQSELKNRSFVKVASSSPRPIGLLLLASLTLFTAKQVLANGEGPGGGDSCAQQFVVSADQILTTINKENQTRQLLGGDKLQQIYENLHGQNFGDEEIETFKVKSTTSEIYVIENGQKIIYDAYTDIRKRLILLSRSNFCQIPQGFNRDRLILHELLVSVEIETSGDFRISSLLIGKLHGQFPRGFSTADSYNSLPTCKEGVQNTCEIQIYPGEKSSFLELLSKNSPLKYYKNRTSPNLQDFTKIISREDWVLKSNYRMDTHRGTTYTQYSLKQIGKGDNKIVRFRPDYFSHYCEHFTPNVFEIGSPDESERSQYCDYINNGSKMEHNGSWLIPMLVTWKDSATQVLFKGRATGRSLEVSCFVNKKNKDSDNLCNFLIP